MNVLSHALVFLSLGIITGIPRLAGIAGVAAQISWMLLVIGGVLLLIHLIWKDGPPTV